VQPYTTGVCAVFADSNPSASEHTYPSGTPYQVHVSAAKAAVDATSAVLAVEEGPHGIRSNVIAPGLIAGTEGDDRLLPKDPTRQNHSPLPLGRKGDSRDIANATVFLFSDAASYISGQILVVDGAYEHLRVSMLPYPESVLDPASTKHLIKARM
jgi:peroxisomal 2,4-dienoyl-CoA reductase